ncbi:metallophosphoesterase [Streptomyces sp. NPDC000594]|uniref:metallophosphoesterase n=1 Tax=Streptomyces sp. NPDC000594 TaxID=3154261 RepID=UPI0033333281
MVEGSMTQGAGQGPAVRTATGRDFRVPPYAQVPVQSETAQDRTPEEQTHLQAPPALVASPPVPGAAAGYPDAGIPPVAPPPYPHEAPQTHHAHPPHPHQVPPQQTQQAPEHPGAHPHDRPQHHHPVTHQPEQHPAHPVHPADHLGDHLADPRAVAAPAVAAVPAAHTAHPGNALPDHEPPEGYTPTERDLPVIGRGLAGDLHTRLAPEGTDVPDGLGPLFVVGDVHGYLDELIDALTVQGLIDADGHWAAGNARLWFLGDFTDRGPDGIGVIDLVMRLSAEAAAAGGYCKALMGNHELLLLGAKRFGDTPINSGAGTATFQAAWLLNGGQKYDMDRLQDVHLQWMSRLDAIVEEDRHLLLHSDTTAYLEYGDTIEDVNETVHEILTRNDADECWDLFRKFTKRFAFRDETGPLAVRELLSAYGGERVVHGHSPIPYLTGEVGTEDGEDGDRPVVEGPHVYADGLAIAMDGGVTMAGKLLVRQLPLPH